MRDADIISVIRSLRKLITTLDSIGFPMEDLLNDESIRHAISKKMPDKIISLSKDIHKLLHNLERSKKYKDAIKNIMKRNSDG